MKNQDFTRAWIRNMLGSIQTELDEKTQMALMESCGRACARSRAITSAKACGADLAKLELQLRKWVGRSNVRREGSAVHIVYDKCYCRLDDDVSKRLGATHCYCSRGWLKEMFETVAGKAVEIDLLESIKRGGPKCRFVVRLPEC